VMLSTTWMSAARRRRWPSTIEADSEIAALDRQAAGLTLAERCLYLGAQASIPTSSGRLAQEDDHAPTKSLALEADV
jgi:hypothetical protein